MKKQEITSLSINDLKEKIAIEKTTYENLKFTHAISPIENPMLIRAKRKEIAKLLTELNAKSE